MLHLTETMQHLRAAEWPWLDVQWHYARSEPLRLDPVALGLVEPRSGTQWHVGPSGFCMLVSARGTLLQATWRTSLSRLPLTAHARRRLLQRAPAMDWARELHKSKRAGRKRLEKLQRDPRWRTSRRNHGKMFNGDWVAISPGGIAFIRARSGLVITAFVAG